MDLGLERIRRLLQALGNPEKGLNVIHVAGTNGKGSVCAYIASTLRAAGLTVGRFNSPHLLEPRDSVNVNGHPVSATTFNEATAYVAETNDKCNSQATPFEQLVATALHIFKAHSLDWVVIEVGLGGLLDATNVFDNPRMTIITAIGWDHAQILGGTVTAIAKAKAGIMKPNCPVVIAPQDDDTAMETLISCAKDTQSPYLVAKPAEWTDNDRECKLGFTAFDEWWIETKYQVPLLGDYQLANSATAATALLWLRRLNAVHFDDDTLRRGFAETRWPGRLDYVKDAALDGTPLPPILVDGAHNPPATMALRRYIDSTAASKVVWIIGVTTGKDINEMMSVLVRSGDSVVAVPFSQPEGMPWIQCVEPEEIVHQAPVQDARAFDTLSDALQIISKMHANSDDSTLVCLCGSLYLVADFYRLVSPSIHL